MSDPTPRRKLAAILAADVVGFSRLMGEDENRTLKNLKACRAITDQSITDNHGRIFNTAGDSVIAEFASPVDAVVAAIEFQKILRDRNAACAEEDRIQFRVGLNLGDVIVEGTNLYGEGINIAARLESIASPGGICVAQSVFTEVRKKLNGIGFSPRGPQSLKNIADPVEVYDISATMQKAAQDPALEMGVRRATAFSGKPLVFIEPIRTTGGGDSAAVLAAGLFDGIAASMMKSAAIVVIKNTDGSTKHPNETQPRLRYKVTGSIQAAGSKLRIFIALERADTGEQIWSQRFDRSSEDIFEIQDEIVKSLSLPLRYSIKTATFERLADLPDASLSLPDLLDKAAGFLVRDGRKALKVAEKSIDEALLLDPNHSMALAMKALSLGWHFDLSPFPVTEEDRAKFLSVLETAIRLDPLNYWASALKAQYLCDVGAFKEGVRCAEVAMRIYPDLAEANAAKALAAFYLHGKQESLAEYKKWDTGASGHLLALALFAADERDEAIERAERVFELMAGIAYPRLCAAAILCAYAEDGPVDPHIRQFIADYPDLNASNCRRPVFGAGPAAARFEAGLKKIWPAAG
ncbi:MAG: adenylate/guanylate cyclase domain-containing protein [Rhodoferax sp.]|nr:adenylate/guanylate cyclase domain-containing protein [Rhodoferax sp.]